MIATMIATIRSGIIAADTMSPRRRAYRGNHELRHEKLMTGNWENF